MTCHGKYWPQEITARVLGYKDNLYAYKSIIELVSAQEKNNFDWESTSMEYIAIQGIFFAT